MWFRWIKRPKGARTLNLLKQERMLYKDTKRQDIVRYDEAHCGSLGLFG
jgi:hypothetical protein